MCAPALLCCLAGKANGVADLGPRGAGVAGRVGGYGELGIGGGRGLGGVDEPVELAAGNGAWHGAHGGASQVAVSAQLYRPIGDDGVTLAVGAELAVAVAS